MPLPNFVGAVIAGITGTKIYDEITEEDRNEQQIENYQEALRREETEEAEEEMEDDIQSSQYKPGDEYKEILEIVRSSDDNSEGLENNNLDIVSCEEENKLDKDSDNINRLEEDSEDDDDINDSNLLDDVYP